MRLCGGMLICKPTMAKKPRSTPGNFRAKWYPYLVRRDGEHCRICGRKPTDVYLEIDHKDDNPKNNHPDNLQLLCRSDNRKKTGRGRGKQKPGLVQDGSVIDREKISTAEFKKNAHCEPRFRHWLYEEMRKHGDMLLHEVINGGAEAAGCSPITVKRYLAKVCSNIGLYEIYLDDTADVNKVRFKSGLSVGITADLLGDSGSTEMKR